MDFRIGEPSKKNIEKHFNNEGIWLVWNEDNNRYNESMHICVLKLDSEEIKFKWLHGIWAENWYSFGSSGVWKTRKYVPLSKDLEFVSWSSLE